MKITELLSEAPTNPRVAGGVPNAVNNLKANRARSAAFNQSKQQAAQPTEPVAPVAPAQQPAKPVTPAVPTATTEPAMIDQFYSDASQETPAGTPILKRGTAPGSSPAHVVTAIPRAGLALGKGAVQGAIGAVTDTDQIVKDLRTGAGMTLGAGTRLHQPGLAGTGKPTGYIRGKVDPDVANYLKQAAGNQPLKQPTGNEEIDTILQNAGLLKK